MPEHLMWKCPKYEDFPEVQLPGVCDRGIVPTLSACYSCGHREGYEEGREDGIRESEESLEDALERRGDPYD